MVSILRTLQVFETVDKSLHVEWSVRDGDAVEPGAIMGVVTGSVRSILVAERVALNFMQRMSGVATATRRMVEEVKVRSVLYVVVSGVYRGVWEKRCMERCSMTPSARAAWAIALSLAYVLQWHPGHSLLHECDGPSSQGHRFVG